MSSYKNTFICITNAYSKKFSKNKMSDAQNFPLPEIHWNTKTFREHMV